MFLSLYIFENVGEIFGSTLVTINDGPSICVGCFYPVVPEAFVSSANTTSYEGGND